MPTEPQAGEVWFADLGIPRPIYNMLVRVASALQEGKVISLVSEMQELTTQAAANILGVSRPHLIKLVESGQLPFHKVGAHRRIRMKDLIAFQQNRDRSRRNALDELARKAQEADRMARLRAMFPHGPVKGNIHSVLNYDGGNA